MASIQFELQKPALTPFEKSLAQAMSDEIVMFERQRQRERERDRSVTKAHIFIVLPHKTSKLCKHSFIVPKSYSALAYHQSTTNRIHLLDFDMLNVGCWKD